MNKLYVVVGILLVGACVRADCEATKFQDKQYKQPTEENIRQQFKQCILANRLTPEQCLRRADNACLNANLEPDCHGVSLEE